jgi:hypothetical protein
MCVCLLKNVPYSKTLSSDIVKVASSKMKLASHFTNYIGYIFSNFIIIFYHRLKFSLFHMIMIYSKIIWIHIHNYIHALITWCLHCMPHSQDNFRGPPYRSYAAHIRLTLSRTNLSSSLVSQ